MVTGLLGVPASQVAMGRSHTAVLTQHGIVYTFGNNSFGQCGRNYKPPKDKGDQIDAGCSHELLIRCCKYNNTLYMYMYMYVYFQVMYRQ